MVTMKTRRIFKNVLGLGLMAFFAYSVFSHMHYLSKSVRPSRATISKELEALVTAFPGIKASAVDIFEKQSAYTSARVRMKVTSNIFSAEDGQSRMEDQGWRKVRVAYGDLLRFCKGDLVAEVTPPSTDRSYVLQVNWGNADAVCFSK